MLDQSHRVFDKPIKLTKYGFVVLQPEVAQTFVL